MDPFSRIHSSSGDVPRDRRCKKTTLMSECNRCPSDEIQHGNYLPAAPYGDQFTNSYPLVSALQFDAEHEKPATHLPVRSPACQPRPFDRMATNCPWLGAGDLAVPADAVDVRPMLASSGSKSELLATSASDHFGFPSIRGFTVCIDLVFVEVSPQDGRSPYEFLKIAHFSVRNATAMSTNEGRGRLRSRVCDETSDRGGFPCD